MDPWDWSPDDVVINLCHQRNLWADRPRSSLPNSKELESSLRENEIDGSTLLQSVDLQTIKDDLGVRLLGQRSAVHHAIKKLQAQSPKFIQQQTMVTSQLHVEPKQNLTRDLTPVQTPPHSDSLARVLEPEGKETLGITLQNSGTQPDDHEHVQSKEGLLPQLAPAKDTRARRGEILIQSKDGTHKRRKLTLDTPSPQPRMPKRSESDKAYLGKSKVELDSMFYNNVKYGESIGDPTKFEDDKDDDPSFFGCSPLPKGKQKVVDRSVKYFLRAEPERLETSRFAFYPYPSHFVSPQNPRSLTLFQKDKSCSLTGRKWMESMINYQSMAEDHPGGNEKVGHEWDYLLSKYTPRGEEDVLPAYNDSGSEGEYVGSLLDELDEAEEERAKQQDQYMTSEQVFQFIDQEIESFQDQWRNKKLPAKEAKAYAVWRTGSGRKRQAALAQAYRDVDRLERRMAKYKKEIASESWKKPQQVRKQCVIIETTVFDMEETCWKIQLWKRNLPPPRVPTCPKIPNPKSIHSVEEEGESLSSEDGDLDGFLEMDDIDPSGTASDRNTPTSKAIGGNVEAWLDHQSSSAAADDEQLPTSTDRSSSPDSVLGATNDPKDHDGMILDGEEPALPDTPLAPLQKQVPVIDLTMSSSPIMPESPLPFSATQGLRHVSNKPELESRDEIKSWSYDYLEENDDRKRLVLRLLHDVPSKRRDTMRSWLNKTAGSGKAFIQKVQEGLQALTRNQKQPQINGVPEAELPTTIAFSRLFICWNSCNHLYTEDKVWIPPKKLKEAVIENCRNFYPFYNFLKHVLGPEGPFGTEDSDLDDFDSPRKRKKFVRRNEKARKLVENAHVRRDQVVQAEKRLVQSSALAGGNFGIIINPGKDDDKDFIQINSHASERMKHHQVNGIRFLWREMVSSSSMQGGLLAHTMGLGKTMQTITFLVTLAEAARSSNPKIRDQIPEDMRQLRTLILCPAGLIENWKEEFRSWRPSNENVGHIYEVTSALGHHQRMATIAAWHNDGGILIIGYELFRELLTKGGKSRKSLELSEDEVWLLKQQLLESPSVVIADEAHKMKNSKSGIGRLAPQFKTQSRIALTGSPLANNLTEYYAMIEWVAPGYLGDIAEFRAYYEKPIQDGNYADSTAYEKRRALKKMEALKVDIDPKVSRADVTVLKDSLPPKTEFLIRVAMTEWQLEAYRALVRYLRHGKNVEMAALWDWTNLLLLLLHHPTLLLEKLEERRRSRTIGRKRGRKPKKAEVVELDEEAQEEAEVPESMLEQQKQIATVAAANQRSPEQSYKLMIIQKIVLDSVNLGDRVLVFSMSLKTLDMLGRYLEALPTQLRIIRMDGSTAATDRMELSRGFNRGQYDVFLISTKAGSLGINIPGANRVILADFGWNPTCEEQAIGRAYRLGQKKPVFVYQLVTAGTFQDVLYQRAIFKRQLAIRAVDKKNVTAVANKPEHFLFEPRDLDREDLCEYKGKDIVLDSILEGRLGKTILNMATEEILRAETNEKLTEEELQEVRQMQEDSKLRLTNHTEWKRREDARLAEEQRRLGAGPPLQELKIPLKPLMSRAQPQQGQPANPALIAAQVEQSVQEEGDKLWPANQAERSGYEEGRTVEEQDGAWAASASGVETRWKPQMTPAHFQQDQPPPPTEVAGNVQSREPASRSSTATEGTRKKSKSPAKASSPRVSSPEPEDMRTPKTTKKKKKKKKKKKEAAGAGTEAGQDGRSSSREL